MKRRQGFTKVEMIVVLFVIAILAAILYPTFRRSEYPDNRRGCSSNLKQLGLAFMQYAQENDECYPRMSFNDVPQSLPPYGKPFGWADALQPYLRSVTILQCPTLKGTERTKDATQKNFTDYWYNTDLSNLKLDKIVAPAQTLMCGDGNDGNDDTSARYNLNVLPPSWISTERSPARRHLDRANYLFVDGHVKVIQPSQISTAPVAQSSSTFSFR